MNVGAYRQDYNDYIFTYAVSGDIVSAPNVFVPFNATQADNLGSVKITGADLTVGFLATPDDLFNIGVEYITTKIGSGTLRCTAPRAVDNGPCAAINFRSPEGLPLPNTPEWRLTASYEHTFEFTSGATLVPRIQTAFESGRFMDLFQSPRAYQDSFTKTDLSITFTAPDGSWNLGAWVQNLEDEAVFQTAGAYTGQLTQFFPSGHTAVYRAPRTWGIRAGAKF